MHAFPIALLDLYRLTWHEHEILDLNESGGFTNGSLQPSDSSLTCRRSCSVDESPSTLI